MVQARSCIGKIVQLSLQRARAYQNSFYAMVDAPSCIGEMIKQCVHAIQVLCNNNSTVLLNLSSVVKL